MYANDTGILTSSESPNEILNNLKHILSNLDEYYTKWKIQINTDKTQSAFFTITRKKK